MAELKTKENNASVKAFLNAIENDQKRKDCKAINKMMKTITGKSPKMWGTSIVGFDSYHYKYDSGREGDWYITGFSPRKQNITVYIMSGFPRHQELVDQLGKYKTGRSCLYFKKLSDINLEVFQELVETSFNYMSDKYNK